MTCEVCGGNCDHGELVQGICPECLEVKEKERARAALLEEIEKSNFSQLELKLEVEDERNNNFN